jgi:DNA-binding beta-propeller fold protein YncE
MIGTGKSAHWLAISHSADRVFASCKTSDFVAVIDRKSRAMTSKLLVPELAEGLAVSPDGATLFVCAHRTARLHVFDTQSLNLRHTLDIGGGARKPNQLRRVRVSPDGRFICVSSLIDDHLAIFEQASLKQIASVATPKAPMGFGFAADGRRAYLCCHDDATVVEFELDSGRILRQFPTASGCEFIIAY